MNLKETIRIITDFPEKGISYKDITTLLKNPVALKEAIDQLIYLAKDLEVDIVAGPEARGFIFGTAIAYSLNAGFIPVRKPGKLPAETISQDYSLEYGKNRLEIHRDSIAPGQKVLIVDDLLATGGTLSSTAKLIEKLGGQVVGIFTLIELTELKGIEKIKGYNVKSIISYPY